jgi:hypothetical protein
MVKPCFGSVIYIVSVTSDSLRAEFNKSPSLKSLKYKRLVITP